MRAKTREGIDSPVMHACGHDTHMSAWIGTATALAGMKDKWSGTLVMILQPAEEIGLGAKAMLDDGLFTRFPHPTHAIAFHDMPDAASGVIGLASPWALANVDSVDLTVRGVGGHGAYPHKTVDPIVLASRIVTTLQTLVSRENDPQAPAVVTVGSFVAGTKHNIIPDESQAAHHRAQLFRRGASQAARRHPADRAGRGDRGRRAGRRSCRSTRSSPITRPRPTMCPSSAIIFSKLYIAHFGADRVIKSPPTMAGEDFSQFWRTDNKIRSFIVFVGAVPAREDGADQRRRQARQSRCTARSGHRTRPPSSIPGPRR